MDSAEIVAAVRAERIDLAGFLDGLDQRERATGSLCAGWTVHDILAQLRETAGSTRRLPGSGPWSGGEGPKEVRGQATARVRA